MNITFLMPAYPRRPVGGYRVVYEYASHLAAKHHTVNIVHSERLVQKNAKIGFYDQIVKLLRKITDTFFPAGITWQKIHPAVSIVRIPEILKEYIPDSDAIIATSWRTAEYVNNFPTSKGNKYYLIQHYENWGGPEADIIKTWKYPLTKIVISKWLYDKGIELGVSPHDLIYITNGLDFEVFSLQKPIDTRRQRVAMMYSKLSFKGSSVGIDALLHARDKCPYLEAVVFGTTRRPRRLPSWIEYHQNPAQDFLVKNIYNVSSIYLCSSLSEGWGLPGAESMACGCALVSTDNGGVREYAIHGITALLSQVNDAEALGDNVVKLINDNDLRIKIATAGHEYIQSFTWERAVQKFEKAIST